MQTDVFIQTFLRNAASKFQLHKPSHHRKCRKVSLPSCDTGGFGDPVAPGESETAAIRPISNAFRLASTS